MSISYISRHKLYTSNTLSLGRAKNVDKDIFQGRVGKSLEAKVLCCGWPADGTVYHRENSALCQLSFPNLVRVTIRKNDFLDSRCLKSLLRAHLIGSFRNTPTCLPGRDRPLSGFPIVSPGRDRPLSGFPICKPCLDVRQNPSRDTHFPSYGRCPLPKPKQVIEASSP